jgi:O-antigen/teichoic acid export membrane protein
VSVWDDPTEHPDRVGGPAGFARLSRDSAIFALGSVAGKLVAVVTLPVFTRLMEPDAYGRLDLLSTLGSAAISLLSLGMDIAALRLSVDPARDAQRRKATMGAWLLLAVLVAGAAAIAALLSASAMSTALFGDATHAGAVATLALIVGAGILQVQGLTLLRIQGRAVAYSGLVTGTLVLNAVLGIAFLVLWTRDEQAPLVALGISWALGAGAAGVLAARGAVGRFRSTDVSELLGLALPLVPALAATWLAEFGNRAILLAGGGAAELAYLSIGLRLASIGGLVVIGFQLAWQPRALSLGSSAGALERLASDARRILMVCSMAVAVVGLVAPEVVRFWSGPAYGPSLPVTGICLVGTLCSAALLVATLPSVLVKRTINLTIAGIVGAAVSLGLNLAVASGFGAEGTAASIAIGVATTAGLAWHLGTRGLGIPRLWPRPLVVMTMSAGVALLSTMPPDGAPIWIRALLLAMVVVLVLRDGTIRAGYRALRGLV